MILRSILRISQSQDELDADVDKGTQVLVAAFQMWVSDLSLQAVSVVAISSTSVVVSDASCA